MPESGVTKHNYLFCQFVNPARGHEGDRCDCFDTPSQRRTTLAKQRLARLRANREINRASTSTDTESAVASDPAVTDEFRNKRKRSGILDGNIVKGAIVLDGTKGATASFGDEEERNGKWRLGWVNVTFLQVVIDVFFEGEILSRGEMVDTAFLDVGIRFEVNRMVPRLMLR